MCIVQSLKKNESFKHRLVCCTLGTVLNTFEKHRSSLNPHFSIFQDLNIKKSNIKFSWDLNLTRRNILKTFTHNRIVSRAPLQRDDLLNKLVPYARKEKPRIMHPIFCASFRIPHSFYMRLFLPFS